MLSRFSVAVLRGQWISILIAGTGIFATVLSDTSPSSNFPMFMNCCNYLLLSTYIFRQRKDDDGNRLLEETRVCDTEAYQSLNKASTPNGQRVSKYMYLLAAVLDCEANFLVLEAYNYTSITSVMLLDCFTIPCAMVLSAIFLNCRYTWKHLAGVFICLSGLVCIVLNDYLKFNGDDSTSSGTNPLIGDILCLMGAVLYASSNVLQEKLVKFSDRNEFLGYLGIFGTIIGTIQFCFVDLSAMRRAQYDWKVISSMFGFVGCLFLMYTNTSAFLQQSDAIVFNLSLLTSDVYAVVFTYFFEGYLVSWLYFLSFLLVMTGLTVYHYEKSPELIAQELLNRDSSSSSSSPSRIEEESSKNSSSSVSSPFNSGDSSVYIDGDMDETEQLRSGPLSDGG